MLIHGKSVTTKAEIGFEFLLLASSTTNCRLPLVFLRMNQGMTYLGFITSTEMEKVLCAAARVESASCISC